MARKDWIISKKNNEKAQLEVFKQSFAEILDASIHLIDKDPPDGYLLFKNKRISNRAY